MLSNIFRAPVGVPENADEIFRQASLCTFVSLFTRYFLLRPPAQDTHAYNMIGSITAVYPFLDGFIPHVLPTICLHGINAVVALLVIRVIFGFEVSLLSRVTPTVTALFPSKVQVLNHSLARNPNQASACD